MPDIRTLKRRLYQLQHQPSVRIKKTVAGERLFKEATEEHKKRRQDNYKDAYNRSYEAAGDLMNLANSRIVSFGGIGPGYRLGSGRWRYINGKWEKRS